MHVRSIAFALAAIGLCALTSARGADLSADCKPVFAAMEKSLQANHTTTTTHGADVMRGVTVDGTLYLQIGGAWRKSPISVQDNLAMSRENLKSAREYTCKALPDSVVDGTPVANYATHTVNDDAVIDSRIEIAKGSGLAVSVENQRAGEHGGGLVTKYSYGNVKAPI
jgi:hypothetical protein